MHNFYLITAAVMFACASEDVFSCCLASQEKFLIDFMVQLSANHFVSLLNRDPSDCFLESFVKAIKCNVERALRMLSSIQGLGLISGTEVVLSLDGNITGLDIEDFDFTSDQWFVPLKAVIGKRLKLRLNSRLFLFKENKEGGIEVEERYTIKGRSIILEVSGLETRLTKPCQVQTAKESLFVNYPQLPLLLPL